MKNKKILWIILVGALLLISILVLIFTYKPKKMNVFTFPTEVTAKNYTKYQTVDTMAMVILNKLMKYDTIHVNIYYFNIPMFNSGDIKLLAFVDGNTFQKHTYNVFLNKDIVELNMSRVISHEMLHVQQIENGDLIQALQNNIYCIYKNDTIFYAATQYDKRPFEINASNNEQSIEYQLNKLLYKK